MTSIMAQKIRKRKICAIRLDIHKAYDTISWDFLRTCLSYLGFTPALTSCTMSCVSSVLYRVRVNGQFTDHILPKRGLCQGILCHPFCIPFVGRPCTEHSPMRARLGGCFTLKLPWEAIELAFSNSRMTCSSLLWPAQNLLIQLIPSWDNLNWRPRKKIVDIFKDHWIPVLGRSPDTRHSLSQNFPLMPPIRWVLDVITSTEGRPHRDWPFTNPLR